MIMETAGKVFAIGNSNAIRIPKIIMDALLLKSGDRVTIETKGESIIIRKKEATTGYPSIDELFEGYSGTYRPVEMDASDCVGREVF